MELTIIIHPKAFIFYFACFFLLHIKHIAAAADDLNDQTSNTT